MDLRVVIAAAGAFVALVSLMTLFNAASPERSLGGDIVAGFALVLGLVTIVSAPVLSGLIRYSTMGTFEFTWWW